SEVWAVAFSADGATALTGCRDGKVRLWEPRSGKLLRALQQGPDVRTVSAHPDGRLLLVSNGTRTEGCARLWDTHTGKLVAQGLAGAGRVYAAAFSRDGRRFVTAAGEGTVQVWRTEGRERLGAPLRHPARVVTVAFSPDGTWLVTGCTDQRARLWDVDAG